MEMAEMKLTVMPDGKIKIITDGPIPETLHASADELIKFLHRKAGGERETEKLYEGHVHQHAHSETHVHQHQ